MVAAVNRWISFAPGVAQQAFGKQHLGTFQRPKWLILSH
jgi:hypothetical protein